MTCYFYRTIDSTNIEAKKLAEQGEGSGSVVWALEQTAGRGRLGKRWTSVSGKGLYASFIFRLNLEFSEYAKSTLVAGVAVARFLKEELAPAHKRAELTLKWPNDSLVSGKKIAGILAESGAPGNSEFSPYLVVGVGVNVLQKTSDFPLELQQHATSLFLETGKQHRLEPLLARLKEHLCDCMQSFEQGRFLELLAEWRTMDYLFGKKMECVNVKGDVVAGVSLGPDDSGLLHIIDDIGQKHEILSGDLRLAGGLC